MEKLEKRASVLEEAHRHLLSVEKDEEQQRVQAPEPTGFVRNLMSGIIHDVLPPPGRNNGRWLITCL